MTAAALRKAVEMKRRNSDVTERIRLAAQQGVDRLVAAHRFVRGTCDAQTGAGPRLLVAIHERDRARRFARSLFDQGLYDSFVFVDDTADLGEALSSHQYDLVVADEDMLPQCRAAGVRVVVLNGSEEAALTEVRALRSPTDKPSNEEQR